MSAVVQHPRAVELVARRKLRRKVEAPVDRLLTILDELDTDPEAEPSLGASIVLYPAQDDQRLWAIGANDDREQDVGDEGEVENEHGSDLDRGEVDDADLEGVEHR